MGIGVGLVLAAIGAILYFGVTDNVDNVNVGAIGIVLMVIGALGVLLDLVLFMPRRRRTVVTQDGTRQVTDADV